MGIHRDNELRTLTYLQCSKDLLNRCYPIDKGIMKDVWSLREALQDIIDRQTESLKKLEQDPTLLIDWEHEKRIIEQEIKKRLGNPKNCLT